MRVPRPEETSRMGPHEVCSHDPKKFGLSLCVVRKWLLQSVSCFSVSAMLGLDTHCDFQGAWPPKWLKEGKKPPKAVKQKHIAVRGSMSM